MKTCHLLLISKKHQEAGCSVATEKHPKRFCAESEHQTISSWAAINGSRSLGFRSLLFLLCFCLALLSLGDGTGPRNFCMQNRCFAAKRWHALREVCFARVGLPLDHLTDVHSHDSSLCGDAQRERKCSGGEPSPVVRDLRGHRGWGGPASHCIL